MELKYYLRGLGLGIVVTAIIMGIVSSGSSAMTDEEIIARAKQLGMIEGRVLSEATQEEKETSGKDSADDVKAAADGVNAADENNPAAFVSSGSFTTLFPSDGVSPSGSTFSFCTASGCTELSFSAAETVLIRSAKSWKMWGRLPRLRHSIRFCVRMDMIKG